MWLHLLQKGSLAYDPEPLVEFRRHLNQASQQNWTSGLALEEHRLLILKHALADQVPRATKFHVLWSAEEALRLTPSTRIRKASEQLVRQLGRKSIFIHRILRRIRRTLTRWKRSILKRIFK